MVKLVKMCAHFFNFCVEEADECRAGAEEEADECRAGVGSQMCRQDKDTEISRNRGSAKPAKLLLLEDLHVLSSMKDLAQNLNFSPITLLCVTPGVMVRHLLSANNSETLSRGEELKQLLALADAHHSDLLPGVYEGGLKIWECAYDLVQYLVTCDIEFSGLRVLELGCGAGLPGITAILKGAEITCFQDYNEEVLRYLTVPNVYLSTSAHPHLEGAIAQCRFYSGDWIDVTTLMITNHDVGFDVILTAETIYCAAYQPVLLQTFKDLISLKPSSVVVVAAKTHYFGVGGSVQMFRELVERDGFFDVVSVKTIDSHLPRQILILRPHI